MDGRLTASAPLHPLEGRPRPDRTLCVRNLGDGSTRLTKMAESSPASTPAVAARIRDETYSAAWPSWSTTSIATPLPPTGATARPPPMARFRAVAGQAPGTSKYGSERRLFYTISPTSTRRSTLVNVRPIHLCARRPAVHGPTCGSGALHRHGRLHRSSLP